MARGAKMMDNMHKSNGEDWDTQDRLGLCLDVVHELELLEKILGPDTADSLTDGESIDLAMTLIGLMKHEVIERM